jgi:LEA14-like dessication related protein
MASHYVAATLALSALLSSCASGPVVPMPPSVRVVDFNSTVITPDAIKFVAKVAIENEMRGPLEIQRVDFGADLHDSRLFDDSFSKVRPMNSRSTTTLTLPFQVAMTDIGDRIEDVVAEEAVRVTLHGTVYPVGFEPIPFVAEKVIPMPRVPNVALAGTRGNPLEGEFTVFLDVENTNHFPISCGSVETFLKLNGKRYDLMRTEGFSNLRAGATGRVALTMRATRAKGLSMIINVAKNHGADFAIAGQMSCQTPHGLILLPVDLSGSPAAPVR